MTVLLGDDFLFTGGKILSIPINSAFILIATNNLNPFYFSNHINKYFLSEQEIFLIIDISH